MKLLAIETTTDVCSVAVLNNGEISEFHEQVPRRHAELVMGAIDGLLTDNDLTLGELDAVAFGRGPGSFTGVRIGAAVAQGIAFGAELPVVPVSSLAALAQGAFREFGWRRIVVAQDARMGEVYAGAFVVGTDDRVELVGEETVLPPDALELPAGGGWGAAGSAFDVYRDVLNASIGISLASIEPGFIWPRARDVALLGAQAWRRGEHVGAADAQPVYLRDTVTRPKAVPS
jgi:tRNA threonylcarbamoyladenosine biosynthesis protein TsaB